MKQNNDELWLKQIGNRLREYAEPAPSQGWERLMDELPPAAPSLRRSSYAWRSYTRWLVAAVLLGVVSVVGWRWLAEPEAPTLLADKGQTVLPVDDGSSRPAIPAVSQGLLAEASPRRVKSHSDGNNLPTSILVPAVTEETATATETVESRVENREATGHAIAVTEDAVGREEENGVSSIAPRRQRRTLPITTAPRRQRRSNHDWSVGMAVGGQSLLASGSQQMGIRPVYSSDFSSQTGFIYLSYASKELLSLPSSSQIGFREGMPYVTNIENTSMEYDHKQPVTVGVTVRKALGSGFSVESGLTYTLLASDVRHGETGKELSQKLHYVGIPLRGNWNFYDGRRFTAYISAGGAVEKCVSGRSGDRHLSVHPLQFSLTGAVGMQVSLTSRLGLYLEPGVTHYFDDGSDVQTIRKEHPTGFTLQTGLRLTY